MKSHSQGVCLAVVTRDSDRMIRPRLGVCRMSIALCWGDLLCYHSVLNWLLLVVHLLRLLTLHHLLATLHHWLPVLHLLLAVCHLLLGLLAVNERLLKLLFVWIALHIFEIIFIIFRIISLSVGLIKKGLKIF